MKFEWRRETYNAEKRQLPAHSGYAYHDGMRYAAHLFSSSGEFRFFLAGDEGPHEWTTWEKMKRLDVPTLAEAQMALEAIIRLTT